MKVRAHVTLCPRTRIWEIHMFSDHDWPWFHEYYFVIPPNELTTEDLWAELAQFKERCSTFEHLRKKSLAGPILD